MNWKFTRLYVICYFLILFWDRAELWPFNQRWSFFFLGRCMLEYLSFKGYSSAKENFANKYSCVYSLLQMTLILFSKLFFVVH